MSAVRRIGVLLSTILIAPCLIPATMAQVPHGIGFWKVQARSVVGRRCASWIVLLAVEEGRLTGVLHVNSRKTIIQNLVLQPDGSFAGTTAADRAGPTYEITGQFTGDVVSVTINGGRCPLRSTIARRQPVGY